MRLEAFALGALQMSFYYYCYEKTNLCNISQYKISQFDQYTLCLL